MQQRRVTGDDWNTGHKQPIYVNAPDETEAKSQSFARGVFPKLVERIDTTPPLPPGFVPRSYPVCGCTLQPVMREMGSVLICIVLFPFGILPGLLYALLAFGKYWACPNCWTRLGNC